MHVRCSAGCFEVGPNSSPAARPRDEFCSEALRVHGLRRMIAEHSDS